MSFYIKSAEEHKVLGELVAEDYAQLRAGELVDDPLALQLSDSLQETNDEIAQKARVAYGLACLGVRRMARGSIWDLRKVVAATHSGLSEMFVDTAILAALQAGMIAPVTEKDIILFTPPQEVLA